MNLSKIDLNLFVVFDAIYTEGNLTRAGQIIGITQPAVSNALARLREAFNDPLFIRSAQGMVPTPIAQNIIVPVRQALSMLRTSMQESDSFVPSRSEKKFKINLQDAVSSFLTPHLLSKLGKEATKVSLDIDGPSNKDIANAFTTGQLDLAIASLVNPHPQLKRIKLVESQYVCVVRKDHPISQLNFTLDSYVRFSHVNLVGCEGLIGPVDTTLGKMGIQRRVIVNLPHYTVAPKVVASTDLALTLPEIFAKDLDLKKLEVPFKVEPYELYLYWHETSHNDPANQWLRDQIIAIFHNLLTEEAGSEIEESPSIYFSRQLVEQLEN